MKTKTLIEMVKIIIKIKTETEMKISFFIILITGMETAKESVNLNMEQNK